ncbi:MAG: putative TIM-barrel fold metal-dependent hydrolase [Acidimicrobiales bacterium]|nr:putative TIM-barrel fold metal-dependent hydrolase [Acidimicrobiales bacterium]
MSINIDDLAANTNFTAGGKSKTGGATFLPEPERRERHYTVISADDHIVEPPDTFAGRVPAKFADRAPRVVELEDGSETWVYDSVALPNVGFNAVVGRPVAEYSFEPARFDEMRRGAWDIDARIADMDLNGVYASVNFPSFLPGFAGQRLQMTTTDKELAFAAFRAWNDWHIEAWAGPHPGRIIPCQLPWLLDPEVGAAEVYRNAERGFKAITFSEAPQKLGLPSLHTGHWDPIMRACAETGTVVNLHIGSSGTSPATSDDAPPDTVGVLFFAFAMFAAVDWLYSLLPVRFPDLKVCLSEGGIGWVAGLMDRLDHMLRYHEMYGTWSGIELTPAEVLHRNFWFCAVEDPSAFVQRDRIGVENILVESDYPHCDSTWPNTQAVIRHEIGDLPSNDVRRITWENAATLYRHPVPPEVQADPNAY